MSAALMLGDVVELEDGREGQVWTPPVDGVATVATGAEFVKAREANLKLVERVLPERGPANQTAKVIKARKAHDCGCESSHFADEHQCIGIKPGQQYVRSVLFPGDINGSRQPWVMKLCLSCARQYDDVDPARLVVKS